jgi:hypothetical protein
VTSHSFTTSQYKRYSAKNVEILPASASLSFLYRLVIWSRLRIASLHCFQLKCNSLQHQFTNACVRFLKLKLLFSQYYDDRCFLEGRYTEVTSCECGCIIVINMVSSWISNCQREEIVNTRHQLMAEIDRVCYPYEFLSYQIRKLLCENSQEGLAEQFWAGNWQPGHTATIVNTVQSYKMRNGTWSRYASRIVRKCYMAIMNCLLDMRCLSPKNCCIFY